MDSQLKQQGLQNLLDTEQTPQVNQQKSITFVDYQCHSLTTWMESSTSNSIPTLKWEKKFLPRLPAAILDQIDIKSVVQSLMFWEDDLPNSSILRNEVIEWKMYWENKKKKVDVTELSRQWCFFKHSHAYENLLYFTGYFMWGWEIRRTKPYLQNWKTDEWMTGLALC